MKIRVVRFCTVPLVATSQKTPVLTPPATGKIENAFLCGNSKNTSYKLFKIKHSYAIKKSKIAKSNSDYPSLHIEVLVQIVSQGLSHLLKCQTEPRQPKPRHVNSHRARSHPFMALLGR
jgi:hypothetical protein